VEWQWVQGHAYDALNRRADRLATQAIDRSGIKATAIEGGQKRLF
jgi:ribonuclease HI